MNILTRARGVRVCSKPRNRRHMLDCRRGIIGEILAFHRPFACIRGNVVERRPYTGRSSATGREIFRELSCRILDRMAISCRGKDKHYEFRSILSLCPVNLDQRGNGESGLTGRRLTLTNSPWWAWCLSSLPVLQKQQLEHTTCKRIGAW